MANQSWITESDLGTFEEESKISGINISYSPTTEYGHTTTGPTLLSSSLPSTMYISSPDNNTVRLYGTLPSVTEDVAYYFTLRLTETDSLGNVVQVDDRYFTLTNQNIPVTWNETINTFMGYNESAFEQSLVSCLNNPNGNETFKKISGTFPTGLTLSDNGVISGYIEEEDLTEIKSYEFKVNVYVDNVEIETCGSKTFTIDVDPGAQDTKPFWVTSEGYIGNANKNEGVNNISISAMDLSGNTGTIKYKLADSTDEHITEDITGLPPGLTLTSKGAITGYTTTSQVKKWYFGAYAYKYIELEDNYIYSDYRKFYINTNAVSAEHEISWIDEDTTYNLGSYCVGEDISGQLPAATTTDGSTVTYYFSGDTYPKGMVLSKDGVISGNLALQSYGTYTFEVMAKTQYTYITRKFKVVLKAGMTDYALRMFLKINLEYKDEYNEIKSQLNPNTAYHESLSNYNVDTFPTIDVATLKCYDREVLASMMNFGNAEIVRFGLTKYLEHTQVDSSGSVVDNYEVYYKSIDESTYQWDELSIGDYDFEEKLEQLKETNDIDEDAELDFNNETYDTYTYGGNIVGKVSSYAKLLKVDTDELNTGDYVIVSLDENNDYTQNYYKLKADGSWICMGTAYPHELLTTEPRMTYNVFNFKNVRELLAEKIYVYQVEGTHYYDCGNQQLIMSADITDTKTLFKDGKNYYISDLDGSNVEQVKFETNLVSTTSGHIITNTLFVPTFDSTQFVIVGDEYGVYRLNQITNPWCFDFARNGSRISIDTIPSGEKMVLPYITASRKAEEDAGITLADSNIIEEDSSIGTGVYYTQFLDEDVEPLPMWKRETAESWKANTTYKTGDIITYSSVYYKVKQQFTSGDTFTYDTNLLEILNGEDVNSLLTKNYFPTLDLGYYETGTNRMYLKNLNAAEKEGNYWYRRDFLFWEMICEPLYATDVNTFGVPFYSNVNPLESIEGRNIKDRTFEIVCDTEGVEVSIVTSPTSYEVTHKGNSWYVKVPSGTYIDWNVSAEGYYSESGSYPIVSDEKNIITLSKKCKITVVPTPSDATVTLTATGYTQEGNSITVREGTIISYTVERDGYVTVEDTVVAKEFDQVIELTLKKYVTLTLQVTPSDASVVLTATGGIAISDRVIKVPEKTYVYYTINKAGYKSRKGSIKVTEDTIYPISLIDNAYTFTVYPTPTDSKVTLVAEHPLGEQIGNSIMVAGRSLEYPTSTIDYTVKKSGYQTVIGSVPYISSDVSINVDLKQFFNVKINYTPALAKITLSANDTTSWEPNKFYDVHALVMYGDSYYNANTEHTSGSEFNLTFWDKVTNSIWVTYGTAVYYNVELAGYKTVNGEYVVKNDIERDINLVSLGAFCKEVDDTQLFVLEDNDSVFFQKENESDSIVINYFTYTVYPTPEDATVTLTSEGATQTGNSIKVKESSTIDWVVSATNYRSQSGQVLLTKNTTNDVTLNKMDYEFTNTDNLATLTKYIGDDVNVVVPATFSDED